MKIFRLLMVSFAFLLSAGSRLNAEPASLAPMRHPPIYAHLASRVALEDDHILVERFVIPPSQSTGPRTYTGNQLVVFVKGGVLNSKGGRSTLWPDGRVIWMQDAGHDEGSTNTGSGPIELLWITLKTAKSVSRERPTYGYLNYPNIPGEDVLENDQVIVQRFKMNPG